MDQMMPMSSMKNQIFGKSSARLSLWFLLKFTTKIKNWWADCQTGHSQCMTCNTSLGNFKVLGTRKTVILFGT